MRPQGVAIAILNAAVWLQRQADTLADVRIALGPSGPVPRRLRVAEAALRGRAFDDQALEDCIQAALEEGSFRTSRHRATKEYRHHVAGVLLAETLTAAWEAALSMG
jgi:CO/xanthine dehydrogenase FAD-binding subunit